MNKISLKYSAKDWFIVVFAGLLAMITIYSLFYPLLGNPTDDKILGIVALVWIFLAFLIMKPTQFKGSGG